MKSEAFKKYLITVVCSLLAIAVSYCIHLAICDNNTEKTAKVGFIYVGDEIDAYTSNFTKAQREIEQLYEGKVETVAKYNVPEDSVGPVLEELAEEKCDLIFTTSYGYGEAVRECAAKYPDIEFCQATSPDANEEPKFSNYHTFMGRIYEGRYISGVVAGMKLKELIDEGKITPDMAKIGYIAAFPFAEVISGYTSFFLGVRSVVPEATMIVKYTNTWSNYLLEKTIAEELLQEDCIIISQHSDTSGPAAACEETDRSQIVYYVSYNESMRDIAPTTYLVGSKINWCPYMIEAVEAVLHDRTIESYVKGSVNGNDIGAGFDNDWVQMLEINEFVVADGTVQMVEKLINDFKNGRIQVFKGDYIGVDPFDPTDTIDLKNGYIENENNSAPSFHYVLKDVITVE